MSENDAQKLKPTKSILNWMPKVGKSLNEPERHKFRMLEESHERPFMPYHLCDREMFAFMLCGRNMERDHARVACAEEFHDMVDCYSLHTQERGRIRLMMASQKVGDKIPRKSAQFWQY